MPQRSRSMTLLLVEDEDDFRETCAAWFRRKGHEVQDVSDAHEALNQCAKSQFDVAVVDMNMPGMSGLELLERLKSDDVEIEIIILTGQATVETAVSAMKLGASDYLTKPFPLAELEQRCLLASDRGYLRKENQQLKTVLKRTTPVTRMIGESALMKEVNRLIERVAPTSQPILILGESGTGKELVARSLHEQSDRRDHPFVVINCGALPEHLVESEFFGHTKGSFTGATEDKPGLFEVADGGTLFIDEIGELPLALQPRLLRVLEDGSLRRVGSTKERRVDVRVISATNRDLQAEVNEGEFREDLFYRLNVITIALPPLRDRAGDVPLLVEHFLGDGWSLENEALRIMERCSWPGNIRQLSHVIERGKILAENQLITVDDLPDEVISGNPQPNLPASSCSVRLEEIERAHIIEILRQEKGNKSRAARELGIHRRKLYRLMERLGIEN